MPLAHEPRPLRMQVIDAAVVRHVMQHPARGYPWTVRDLADVVGCSKSAVDHMRRGTRETIPTELADRFAEAVGVETRVLFEPVVSTDSVAPRQAS